MKENARIEAFSDGVFAIAITLLILELKVPEHQNIHSVSDLWRALIQLWPSYFAFLLSFGIILVSWVNHHYLFNVIDKSSRPFLYANGFLLLTITFMPFPTALLAEYIGTDYMKPAIAFYCFGGVVNSIGWNLLLFTVFKPRVLLHSSVNADYTPSDESGNAHLFTRLLPLLLTCCFGWYGSPYRLQKNQNKMSRNHFCLFNQYHLLIKH